MTNAAVAREVMGEPERELAGSPCPECGGEMRMGLGRAWCSGCSEWMYSAYRSYSDDPAADYSVLVKVQTWDDEAKGQFCGEVLTLWNDRAPECPHFGFLHYQPGDWSLAALAAARKATGGGTTT